MAHILFSYYSCGASYSHEDCLPGKIRMSIFLIIGECVGLPAVVWALRFLYYRYKTGSQVSAFVITLLLCDLLVLLLNPYIVTKLLQNDKCWEKSPTCGIFSSLWSASIICGLHLQQMVALEVALTLRHPSCSAHVFFPICSIIISIILFIYFFFCEVFSATPFVLLVLPLLLCITLTSWIVTCRIPPHISDIPYRTRKPSFTVLTFVTLTLILCIIMSFSRTSSFNVFVMGFSLTSLNVIIDPLLCVIIYRKSTELNQSEVNT